jgi:pimeloyl-ACP methyl ester carboxylesterase
VGTSATPASLTSPSSSLAPGTSAATGVDGLFDIGGRKLWMSCSGSGSPTVVYLHGLGGPSQNVGRIPAGIAPTTRICIYDRANVGKSDPLPGTHTALDSARDLHALLAAAHVDGPVILLGASIGGLIAIDYAGAYPDQVAGLVLLDAILPNDDVTDHLIADPAERQLWQFGDDNNPEGLLASASLLEAAAWASKIGDIPITFLEAKQVEIPRSAPPAAFTAGVFKGREDFLAPFRQHRIVKVDSPHYMEPVIPDQIVAETLRVVALARTSNSDGSPAPS